MSRAHNDKSRYRPPGTIVIGPNFKSKGTEKNQKIPSTTANSRASHEKYDQKFTGMIGNAMTVPPPKKKEEKVQSSRSEITSSNKSQMAQESQYKKELEEAKEKEKTLMLQNAELKQLTEALQKQIEEREKALMIQNAELKKLTEALQKQIQERDETIMELKSSMLGRSSPQFPLDRRNPSPHSSETSHYSSNLSL